MMAKAIDGVVLLKEDGTMNKPWIKSEEKMPKHCELVFCARFDVKHESFQYYVGWYNADKKEWFLDRFGLYELRGVLDADT